MGFRITSVVGSTAFVAHVAKRQAKQACKTQMHSPTALTIFVVNDTVSSALSDCIVGGEGMFSCPWPHIEQEPLPQRTGVCHRNASDRQIERLRPRNCVRRGLEMVLDKDLFPPRGHRVASQIQQHPGMGREVAHQLEGDGRDIPLLPPDLGPRPLRPLSSPSCQHVRPWPHLSCAPSVHAIRPQFQHTDNEG